MVVYQFKRKRLFGFAIRVPLKEGIGVLGGVAFFGFWREVKEADFAAVTDGMKECEQMRLIQDS
ncbi:hypothetical protein D3C73_1330980 [compost metagenome]